MMQLRIHGLNDEAKVTEESFSGTGVSLDDVLLGLKDDTVSVEIPLDFLTIKEEVADTKEIVADEYHAPGIIQPD